MMSSATSVSETLAAYLAGAVTAERVVALAVAEYYRETGNGKREALRPIIEVVERAHPGIVELRAVEQRPGFDVRLTERPFPKRYEAELRQAVQGVLGTFPVSRFPLPEEAGEKPGLLYRIVATVRKLFSA